MQTIKSQIKYQFYLDFYLNNIILSHAFEISKCSSQKFKKAMHDANVFNDKYKLNIADIGSKKEKPILTIGIYHNCDELLLIKPFIESLDLGYKFMFRRLLFSETYPTAEIVLIAWAQ